MADLQSAGTVRETVLTHSLFNDAVSSSSTGEWRKVRNELTGLYSSPSNIRVIESRRMRRAGHVASMGERRGAYRVLVEKPEGKKPLGRPRRRWEHNIKMDLQEVGWGVACSGSGSGQGQVADCLKSGNELSGSIQCGLFLD